MTRSAYGPLFARSREPSAFGHIRNACLRAAFLAAQDETSLRQRHLERAVALELAEIGKLSSSGAIEQWRTMSHEREFDRTDWNVNASQPHDDLAPKRATNSSWRAAPAHPIVSALLQRKACDANEVTHGAEQAVATTSSSSSSALPGAIMRKFAAQRTAGERHRDRGLERVALERTAADRRATDDPHRRPDAGEVTVAAAQHLGRNARP